jgi:hypothetical protein
MNCRPENYEAFIRYMACQWYEIETRGISKDDRAWARRNRLRLMRRHPEIFGDPAGECV